MFKRFKSRFLKFYSEPYVERYQNIAWDGLYKSTQGRPLNLLRISNGHYFRKTAVGTYSSLHLILKNAWKRRSPPQALRILLGSQRKDNHSLVAMFQCNLGIIQCELGNSNKALSNSSVCSSKDEKTTAYIYI
jgi:hypothetical protein